MQKTFETPLLGWWVTFFVPASWWQPATPTPRNSTTPTRLWSSGSRYELSDYFPNFSLLKTKFTFQRFFFHIHDLQSHYLWRSFRLARFKLFFMTDFIWILKWRLFSLQINKLKTEYFFVLYIVSFFFLHLYYLRQ